MFKLLSLTPGEKVKLVFLFFLETLINRYLAMLHVAYKKNICEVQSLMLTAKL